MSPSPVYLAFILNILEVFCNMRVLTILPVFTVLCVLTSCMSYDFSNRIVQQGNLLPKKNLDMIKIGMSKEDVSRIMGSSLLNTTFNDDHWDYIYTWRRGNGPLTERRVSFDFKNNLLTRIV